MLKVREETWKARSPTYNICSFHYVACVCSLLCYGWNTADVECLQGKVKFATQHATGGTEWSTVIELLIFKLGTILGRVFNTKTQPFFLRERHKVPKFTDGWMGLRFGLDGRGEEKTSYKQRGSNPKTSVP